jgi:hypothetical protein
MRSSRVLPGPGALLPGDLQAISRFAVAQPRARMQFTALGKGHTAALLEIGARRLRFERRGETVVARRAPDGSLLESDCIEDLLTAVQSWLTSNAAAAGPRPRAESAEQL